MNELHSHENSQGTITKAVRAFRTSGESAEKLVAAIRARPYLASGIVAGVVLAVATGLIVRAQRRRSFMDVPHWLDLKRRCRDRPARGAKDRTWRKRGTRLAAAR